MKKLALLLLLSIGFSLDSVVHNAASVAVPNAYISFFLHPILDTIGEGSYAGRDYIQIGGCFAQAAKASDEDLIKMVAGNIADVIEKLAWSGFLHNNAIGMQLDGNTTLALDLFSIGYVVGRNFKVWG